MKTKITLVLILGTIFCVAYWLGLAKLFIELVNLILASQFCVGAIAIVIVVVAVAIGIRRA